MPTRSRPCPRPQASAAVHRAALPSDVGARPARRGGAGAALLPALLPALGLIAVVAMLAVVGWQGWGAPRFASSSLPLLNPVPALLSVGPSAATALNGVRPSRFDRGTTRDGGTLRGSVVGFPLGVDPSAVTLSERRDLGGVDLATGGFSAMQIQLALPAHVPWVIGVAYSSGQTGSSGGAGEPCAADSNGPQGFNWMQVMQAELVYEPIAPSAKTANDILRLIYGPDRFVDFARIADNSDSFAAANGAAGVMTCHEGVTSPEYIVLHHPRGTRTSFFGFKGFAPGVSTNVHGQLWKVVDPSGKLARVGASASTTYAESAADAVGAFDSDGLLTAACDSASRDYTYAYTAAIGGRKRLASVTASSGGTIAVVNYEYFGGSLFPAGEHGDAGDLALASTTTTLATDGIPISQTIRSAFRYWGSASTSPYKRVHGLKLVIGPEGTRRSLLDLAPLGVAGLSAIADNDLKPYAEAGIAYDSSGRVAEAFWNGLTPQAAWGTHAIAYEVDSASNTYWERRAIVARTDSAGATTATRLYSTHYFDEWAQPLALVLSEGHPSTATRVWTHRALRDTEGRLQLVGTPASAAAYVHSSFYCPAASPAAGVVTHLDRRSGGDAAFEGFIQATRVGKGDTWSAAMLKSYVDYTLFSKSLTDIDVRAPYLSEVRSYHGGTTDPGDAAKYNTWAFDTAVNTTTLAVEKVTTTEPVVTTTQHGSGLGYKTVQHYRADGTPSFHVSQKNRITHTKYNVASALLERSIQDADSANVGETAPSGVDSDAGEFHIETEYVYDALGRVIEVTDARDRTSVFAYSRLQGGETVRIGVAGKTGAGSAALFKGPSTFVVFNHTGAMVASGDLQPGAQPAPGQY